MVKRVFVDKNGNQIKGDFDYDKNGRPILKKNAQGHWVDKNGNKVKADFNLDKKGQPILNPDA